MSRTTNNQVLIVETDIYTKETKNLTEDEFRLLGFQVGYDDRLLEMMAEGKTVNFNGYQYKKVLFNGYDYVNQAWVINGKYMPCGHAATLLPCNCFGRLHAGESCTTDGTQPSTNGHHQDCDNKTVAQETFMCSELCQYTLTGGGVR